VALLTSVYSAEAMVFSGVLPWHLTSLRSSATLVMSPVDIIRFSCLSTSMAAVLKMPPALAGFWST
jgi:hypothetical protein